MPKPKPKQTRAITSESDRVNQLVKTSIPSAIRTKPKVKHKTLDMLTQDILRQHNKAKIGIGQLKAMILCGDLLLVVKKSIGHGNFSSWRAENFEDGCGLCSRTAQRYMSKAREFDAFLKDKGIVLDKKTTLESVLKDGVTVLAFLNPPASDGESKGEGKTKGNHPVDEWATPQLIVGAANKVMGSIDCDPAASKFFQLVDANGLVFDKSQDGLSSAARWKGNVFASPGIKTSAVPWLEKAKSSVANGTAKCVIVLFSAQFSTDTFLQLAGHPICLIRDTFQTVCHNGKKIREYKLNAPLAAALYSGPSEVRRFIQVFQDLGPIFVPLPQLMETELCQHPAQSELTGTELIENATISN